MTGYGQMAAGGRGFTEGVSYHESDAGGYPGEKRSDHNFCPTPLDGISCIVPTLLEYFPPRIWEPACGDGAISKPLAAAGFNVVSSDLIDRGFGTPGCDFLETSTPLANAIVTNPPFDLAAEFIFHSLAMLGVDHLALFLKATFFSASNRLPLFRGYPPNMIAPLTFRVDFSGQGRPTMETAWFIWSVNMPFSQKFNPIPRLGPRTRTKK